MSWEEVPEDGAELPPDPLRGVRNDLRGAVREIVPDPGGDPPVGVGDRDPPVAEVRQRAHYAQ